MKEPFLSFSILREFWHLAIQHYSPYIGPGREMLWAFMRNHCESRWVKRGLRVSQRGMQEGARSAPYADGERSHWYAKRL